MPENKDIQVVQGYINKIIVTAEIAVKAVRNFISKNSKIEKVTFISYANEDYMLINKYLQLQQMNQQKH